MAGWAAILGRPALLTAAIDLHSRVAAGGAGGGGTGQPELCHALRQLVVQLASVSHRVFGQASGPHAEYAALLLSAASQLTALAPAAAAGGGGVGPGGATAEAPVLGPLAFMDGAMVVQRLVVCAGEATCLLWQALALLCQRPPRTCLLSPHTCPLWQVARRCSACPSKRRQRSSPSSTHARSTL